MCSAVFNTCHVNYKMQQLLVCATPQLRKEKGSSVRGTHIAVRNIQNGYKPIVSKHLNWRHQYDQKLQPKGKRVFSSGNAHCGVQYPNGYEPIVSKHLNWRHQYDQKLQPKGKRVCSSGNADCGVQYPNGYKPIVSKHHDWRHQYDQKVNRKEKGSSVRGMHIAVCNIQMGTNP